MLGRKVNAYFAVLLITALGSWAAWTIITVAYSNTFIITKIGNGAVPAVPSS